jgi:hypothetical protein
MGAVRFLRRYGSLCPQATRQDGIGTSPKFVGLRAI